MANPYDQVLREATEETFGSMAFMFPLSEEEATDGPAGKTVTAQVAFCGPRRGGMTIAVPQEMMAPLAANMLGLEGDTPASDEQQIDALKEILNVICGNLLPLIGSNLDVYNVGAPAIVEAGALGEPAAGQQTQGLGRIYLDGGRVDVAMYVESDGTNQNVA